MRPQADVNSLAKQATKTPAQRVGVFHWGVKRVRRGLRWRQIVERCGRAVPHSGQRPEMPRMS
jgi:hypothetical protein